MAHLVGPLPRDGDEHAAVTTLVRERWWEFNGEGRLNEMDEGPAVQLLTWVFGHGLENDDEVISPDRAGELAATFVSLLPERRRWFGNDWDGPPFPRPILDEKEFEETDWVEVSETLRSGLPWMPPETWDPAKLREAAREGSEPNPTFARGMGLPTTSGIRASLLSQTVAPGSRGSPTTTRISDPQSSAAARRG